MQQIPFKPISLNKENTKSTINFNTIKFRNNKFKIKENLIDFKPRMSKAELIEEKPIKKQEFAKLVDNYTSKNIQAFESIQENILEYLKSKQFLARVDKDYMDFQTDINNRMRAILIDWLVDVNLKFKMLPQTLFMTVNLVDRYMSLKQVNRAELQLLGIAALMIIGKYEEIYPPVLKEYISVCDNAYTREEILRMEESILAAVEFNVSQPNSFYFLQLVHQKLKYKPNEFALAQYILETAMLDTDMLKFTALELVAGAIFLVNKIFNKGGWNHKLTFIFSINEKEAKSCGKELFGMVQKIETTTLTAIKRKFSKPANYEVAKYKIEKVGGDRN